MKNQPGYFFQTSGQGLPCEVARHITEVGKAIIIVQRERDREGGRENLFDYIKTNFLKFYIRLQHTDSKNICVK